MGIFGGRYRYTIPERLSVEEARQRRLVAVLERSRKELEVQPARLSPVNVAHLERLKDFQRKIQGELDARRARLREIDKEQNSISARARTKAAISGLFQLQAKAKNNLQRLRRSQSAMRQQASAADRRFYNPAGILYNPRNIFGSEARTFVGARGRRKFVNKSSAVPCIDRAIRKEVMFAFGHAGKGHRVPHRFNPMSLIGC